MKKNRRNKPRKDKKKTTNRYFKQEKYQNRKHRTNQKSSQTQSQHFQSGKCSSQTTEPSDIAVSIAALISSKPIGNAKNTSNIQRTMHESKHEAIEKISLLELVDNNPCWIDTLPRVLLLECFSFLGTDSLHKVICIRWQECLRSKAASYCIWHRIYFHTFPTLPDFFHLYQHSNEISECDSWLTACSRRWEQDNQWLNESSSWKELKLSWYSREELHVGPDQEFKDIRSAIYGGPFDRIVVHPGQYRPLLITIVKPVEIIGLTKNNPKMLENNFRDNVSNSNPNPQKVEKDKFLLLQDTPIKLDIHIEVKLKSHQTARMANFHICSSSNADFPVDSLSGVESVSGCLQLDDCIVERANVSLLKKHPSPLAGRRDGLGNGIIVPSRCIFKKCVFYDTICPATLDNLRYSKTIHCVSNEDEVPWPNGEDLVLPI